jgi:hypothetical protein
MPVVTTIAGLRDRKGIENDPRVIKTITVR